MFQAKFVDQENLFLTMIRLIINSTIPNNKIYNFFFPSVLTLFTKLRIPLEVHPHYINNTNVCNHSNV